MQGNTARLFELDEASAASRRLVRSRGETLHAPARPAAWEPAAHAHMAPVDFQALVESSATASELWERLLDWASNELAAQGVFVLDQHGFVIAAHTRMENNVPPEVFSAVFAEGSTVLEPYLETGQRIREQEFRIEGLGWISISQHELGGAPVLFCVWRDTRLRQRRIGSIWRRIAGTVVLYDELLKPSGPPRDI